MKKCSIILISILLLSCSKKKEPAVTSIQDFENEITRLKTYFHIPGLSVLVQQDGDIIYENYFGFADIEAQRPVDSISVFPIASLTKTFSTVLMLKLVEEGLVDLEDPINQYLQTSDLSDSVKIKHVLSHSSEGIPGTFFNYSSRFSLLTQVIEKSSGNRLREVMEAQIIKPLGLKNTHPISGQKTIDSLENKLVKPYYFHGTVESGHYDIGFSTSSGLAASIRDIAKFDNALDNYQIISRKSTDDMLSPFKDSEYPYGYGIFTQEFLEKEIKWVFGQEDCFSSLLLKVPEDGLSMILLANNNLMSDPARLINGDITYSLFAMSFLKNFVFNMPNTFRFDDFQEPEKLDFNFTKTSSELKPFYRQEILAHALSACFMGFHDSLDLKRCKKLTQAAFSEFPDYKEYGNQTLMRLLMVLSTFGDIRDFDKQIIAIGDTLLSKNKYDPYTNVYLGYHYLNLDDQEKAYPYFNNIIETPNLQAFWYTIEAYDFMGDYYKKGNPKLSKEYFQKIVDIGWNIGGKLDKAKKELNDL